MHINRYDRPRDWFVLVAIYLFCIPQCVVAHNLSLKPGYSRASVTVNGKKRKFRIYIPRKCPSTAHLPLMIVLHGGLGSGRTAQWDSRMSAQADKNHFIVAYPNGIWRTWNAGGCCGPARSMNIDDVAFMRALIARAKTELSIDPKLIGIAGISNGGMLAYRIGAELGDQVSMIAPIEGCMYQVESAPAENPVSVVAIHGKADRLIPYAGGVGHKFGYKIASASVKETIQYWVERDHCDAQPRHDQTEQLAKDVYANGLNGSEVCL